MESVENLRILFELMIPTGFGLALMLVFSRLSLPPVLGFLITGIVCGPYGLKFVETGHLIGMMAEIGLVLLLFEAGIGFSVKTFIRLKKFLLIAGTLQLAGTIGVTMLGVYMLGLGWAPSAFIGMLVSLSSTAIVVALFEYRGDLDTAHGRAAMSILIFQDLCIVPMVLLTPFLGGQGAGWDTFFVIIGKAVVFLIVAGSVAKFFVPMVLQQAAKTKKDQAFVLSIILLCLGMATATAYFGMSMALGAFIAGLLISDSKYRFQATGVIIPFGALFHGLVFVSIGMLFDVRIVFSHPILVLSLLVSVLLIKWLIATGVTAAMGHSLKVAMIVGLAISQVSEFSFVLAKLGLDNGLMEPHHNQIFLAVAILSMFVTPAMISGGSLLTPVLERFLPERFTRGRQAEFSPDKKELEDHAIIVGLSEAGHHIANVLDQLKISWVVIDSDPEVVRDETERGTTIFYGDATREEVLLKASIEKARVVLITTSDNHAAKRAVEVARRLNPTVTIVATVRYTEDGEDLLFAGATSVISEQFMGALEMADKVMREYDVPGDVVSQQLLGMRSKV